MTESDTGVEVLDRLYKVIDSRRGCDPDTSYTARLLTAGTPVIARKVGEEAIEAMVEAFGGEPKRLAAESADLIYHLLVLWADAGIMPADVWAELARREGTSGFDEKNSRPKE